MRNFILSSAPKKKSNSWNNSVQMGNSLVNNIPHIMIYRVCKFTWLLHEHCDIWILEKYHFSWFIRKHPHWFIWRDFKQVGFLDNVNPCLHRTKNVKSCVGISPKWNVPGTFIKPKTEFYRMHFFGFLGILHIRVKNYV